MREYLEDKGSDLAILTETWLCNSDEHKAKLQCSDLNSDGFKIDNIPRPGKKRGGGIALVSTSIINKHLKQTITNKCFEAVIWKINTNNRTFDLIAIYRPPNGPSITEFTTSFCLFLEDIISNSNDFLITGDFNIHVNDWNNTDALNFLDIIDAIGLIQHVKFPTQNSGNTLDLVLTNYSSKLIKKCSQGSYLSDHCAIDLQLDLHKKKSHGTVTTGRKWKLLSIEKLLEDANLDEINEETLMPYWDSFKDKITHALDEQILIGKIFKPDNTETPWFDTEIKQHKKRLQKAESQWRKFRSTEKLGKLYFSKIQLH